MAKPNNGSAKNEKWKSVAREVDVPSYTCTTFHLHGPSSSFTPHRLGGKLPFHWLAVELRSKIALLVQFVIIAPRTYVHTGKSRHVFSLSPPSLKRIHLLGKKVIDYVYGTFHTLGLIDWNQVRVCVCKVKASSVGQSEMLEGARVH